jgi:hypothetical protein
MPIQVDANPYLHPNCPAYPTNITAEKYDVPNANAVSQDPTFLSPSTNPCTLVALFLQYIPTPIIMAKNIIRINTFNNIALIDYL